MTFWQSEKAFERLPLVLYTASVLKKFPPKQRTSPLGICYLRVGGFTQRGHRKERVSSDDGEVKSKSLG